MVIINIITIIIIIITYKQHAGTAAQIVGTPPVAHRKAQRFLGLDFVYIRLDVQDPSHSQEILLCFLGHDTETRTVAPDRLQAKKMRGTVGG